MSRTAVPSEPGATEIAEFFNQEPTPSDRHCPADRVDADMDTLPNLEPYRREVVAQQPTTFGHRPLSASRMFNPCTMATSCGIPNDANSSTTGNGNRGWKSGASGTRRGASRIQRQPRLKKYRPKKPHRTTGLSAPMLKALLRGGTPAKAPATTAGGGRQAAAGIQGEYFDPKIGSNQEPPTRSEYLVVSGQEDFRDLSDSSIASDRDRLGESMWRSVDPAGGGIRGDLKATWLTNSSQEEERRGRAGGVGDSVEELELRRIFSDEVRTA